MTISPSGSWLRSTNSSPGGGPQCSTIGVGQLGGQRREPLPIVLGGHPDRVAGQLVLGQPVGVLAAALDQRVDQRVAVAGVDARDVADAVAGIAHRAQQRDRAGRGVQSDGVADAGVLGRVGGEHQRHPLVRGRDVAQPGVPHRESGDPGAAFGVGDVGDQPLVVDLLERERNRDDAAVELRHGDLGGDVQRRHPVVVARSTGRANWSGTAPAGSGRPAPPGARRSSCRRRRRRRRVAGLAPPAASTVVTRASAVPSSSSSSGSAVRSDAQYTGSGRPPARFDGVAQRLDVRRCCRPAAGRGSRAPRSTGRRRVVAAGRSSTPQVGVADRRFESDAGHQHVSDRKACRLRQILDTALGEIDVRLQRDARRHRRWLIRSASGACSPLTTTAGTPLAGDRVDAVLPGAVAAENPHHHDVGTPSSSSASSPSTQPRRVGPAVGRAAGAGGDQVGVRRRQQQDGRTRGLRPPTIRTPPAGPVVARRCDGVDQRS